MHCHKIRSIIIQKSYPTLNQSTINAICTINNPENVIYKQNEEYFNMGFDELIRYTDKINFKDLFAEGTSVLIDGVFVDEETHITKFGIYDLIKGYFMED